jgi:hypothetical protein
MSHDNRLSSIPESSLLETLDTLPTIETSVLSSTRIQDQQTEMSNKGVDNLSSPDQNKHVENSNLKQKIDNNNNVDDQATNENDNDDDSFDTFVLQNFLPYSGKENVISRLDATEEKFNRNCIGRNLRFTAISHLVEGVAKRKYIRSRKEIQSYDDFYEFLLTEFENTDNTVFPFKSCQTANNPRGEKLIGIK